MVSIKLKDGGINELREVVIMKGKRSFMAILLLSVTLFISACTPTSGSDNPSNPPKGSNEKDTSKLEQEIKEKDDKILALETNIKELEADIKKIEEDRANEGSQQEHILLNSVNVLKALKEEDMESLKDYIHPQKGVRFSPYPYVDLSKDIVLKRDEIADVYQSDKIHNWGNYDGKGFPIELTFKDYYKISVYDVEFLNPQIIGNNYIVSSGNTKDNVKETYPHGRFVELYFEGFNAEYEGMDWRSLKLVFEEYKGKWYLVGIIHGQWTI